MRASAIVYTSATGFTAQYAALLHHQTGLPVCRLEDTGRLPRNTPVLYLGWLRAGRIMGLKKARAQLAVAGVCAVGLSPAADQEKLSRDNRLEQVPLFYLRGGYAPARVRGINKMMMAAMEKVLSGKSDPQSRSALDAVRQGADWVSQDQLEPALDWLDG